MNSPDTRQPTTSDSNAHKAEISQDVTRIGVAASTLETVSRFGSANAEYIKGYTGIDNETGQVFAKGLADIAKHRVNADPAEAAKNIKQQAGYAAEVATTSRDNAEAIIARSKVRTMRSDDLPEYGRNHNIVDRVQILDGHIIEGSQTQMKFVGDRDQLLKNIAREDGKFARYRGTKLELPSEQYEGAAQHCRKQAEQLRKNAQSAEQHGKPDVAVKLRREADNYDHLANDVRDSGMNTEQAIFYRKHPKIATAFDIARTSHGAGLQGAQYGAAIGGFISLLQNMLALANDEKDLGEAAKCIAIDTTKSAALGYGTAFAGSAVKGSMQQSGKQTVRAIAGSSAPAMAVTICLSLAGSVKRYVTGDITESQLLLEVGESGAGMLSGAMMAALGQMAIPIPVVGAAIGGMIGYTLSSLFYQSALDAARGVELSRQQLERVHAIAAAARERIAEEQAALDAFTRQEIPQLLQETRQLFAVVNSIDHCGTANLAAAINKYASLLGKNLQFQNIKEFDEFMASNKNLTL